MARIDDATAIENRALPLVDLEACVLLARKKEIAHVKTGLEADDVASEQSLEDGVAHRLREDLPVLWRRPRHMHEVREHGRRQRLPHQPRHPIHLAALAQDQMPSLPPP